MVDPPPGDPSGLPPTYIESPQPVQLAGQPPAVENSPQPLSELDQPVLADQPQPISPELPVSSLSGVPSSPLQPGMPKSSFSGGSSDLSQSSESLGRPPLAELDVNGGSIGERHPVTEVVFSSKAVHKKPSSARPSMASSRRNLKKRKTAASHHLLSLDDASRIELEKISQNVDLRSGLAAVVQPLQTVEAEDVALAEEDDDFLTDEEEEFDLEEFHINDEKRSELKCLMEKYDVYDEEQLRLAIRRERKQEKSGLQSLAGNRPPLPDSAPASPSHIPSRFIPPTLNNALINHDDIPSIITPPNPAPDQPFLMENIASNLAQNHTHMHTTTHPMHNPHLTLKSPTPMQTSPPMQNPPIHVLPHDVEDPSPSTSKPHAPPHASETPPPKSTPPRPLPMQAPSPSMHSTRPMQPTPLTHSTPPPPPPHVNLPRPCTQPENRTNPTWPNPTKLLLLRGTCSISLRFPNGPRPMRRGVVETLS